MYHLERQNRLRVFVHVLCPSIERSEKYCFTVSVCLSLKAHLIYTHLLVPRSRSSAKVKVEYQGHISQKLAIWGHYVSQTHLIVLFFFHRDLAARNCLVSSCNPSTMVVKIGDLECTQYLQERLLQEGGRKTVTNPMDVSRITCGWPVCLQHSLIYGMTFTVRL